MKLDIILVAAGLVGVALFFAGAVDFGSADIYASNPWLLGAGGAFFIVFLIGMYRLRKRLRKIGEARNRRF